MIFSKDQPRAPKGFTLIETIIALVILGTVITTLFRFQGELLRGTFRWHATVSRISFMRNMFAMAQEEKWYTKNQTKEIKEGLRDTTLTYSFKKVSENGSLGKYKNLYTEQIQAQWSELTGTRTDTLVGFKFYIPEAS